MKDLHIPASTLIREFRIWFILLILAFLTNVYAIILHDAEWSELVSQLHIVLILSVVYYLFGWVLRGLYRGIKAIAVRR